MPSASKKHSVLLILAATIVMQLCSGRVFAGDGNETGGVTTGCSTFTHGFQLTCGDPDGSAGGGKAWRIYSTSGSGPSQAASSILDGASVTTSDIQSECSGKGYYVSMGWEGSVAKGYGDVQTGPAQWNTTLLADTEWNNYGAKSFSDLQNMTSLTNNLKITHSAAQQIYNLEFGTTTIPNATGYFCITDKVTVSTFEGYSKVISGSQSSSTGWQNKTTTTYLNLTGCNNGCSVSFKHGGKRTKGDKTSSYTIKKGGTTIATGNIGGTQMKKTDGSYTIRTGETICETLTFQPSSGSSTTATTKACAYATGKVPNDPDPGSSDATLDIKVKNNNVSRYGSYTNSTIYAKPGDTISYQTVYNPILQYTYSLKPGSVKINSGTAFSTSSTLGSAFNSKVSPGWKNAFNLSGTNFSYSANKTYTAGNTDQKTEENSVSVLNSHVGKTLKETAKTNTNDTVKTTPRQVTFTFSESSATMTADINTGTISDDASANVPYNFTNTISTKFDGNYATRVYAGETATATATIKINTKRNNTTDGTYATKVDNAQYKFVVYIGNEKSGGTYSSSDICSYFNSAVSNGCYSTGEKTGQTLNSGGATTGATESKNTSFGIPDSAAGTKFCVASAVYPSDSGAETNISSDWSSLGSSWRVSDSVCTTIAKKPTFQVWGGNFYSDGAVSTSVNAKTTVAGYNSYSPENKTVQHVFGSWGEYSIIGSKNISGMASGAAYGYSGSNLALDPGGSSTNDFCKHSPLSIANTSCSNTLRVVGNSGISGNTGVKNGIISYFVPTDTTRYASVSGTVNLSSGSNYKEDTTINDSTRYTYSSGNLSIYASDSLIRNTAHIIYAKGNVTITGDLIYDDDRYASLHQMPQYVIYAEGNINIECGVNRVDAILLAGKDLNTNGKVNTCSDVTSSYNDEKRSNQLTVNGTIIANKLTLGRTYGAGPGDASGIPAEIINVTPATFYWTTGEANSTPSLQVTFQRELSPRY